MHFSTDQQDATTVFRLKEARLDSRNAGQLKAEFLILSQPDIDTLIIDLTDVQHIDSAGLSALLLANRQMGSHDGEVRLVGASEDVRSLLRLTQLDRIFPLFNTVNEALDAEPALGGEDNDDLETDSESDQPLAPGAPSANEIRAGAIVAGGSFGAAALSRIMMTPYEEEQETVILAFGDAEDYDEEEDVDDLDDDFEEDEDFAEEEDADEEDDVEDVEEVKEEDVLEDDLEDDDFDDEELDEDEDDDY